MFKRLPPNSKEQIPSMHHDFVIETLVIPLVDPVEESRRYHFPGFC